MKRNSDKKQSDTQQIEGYNELKAESAVQKLLARDWNFYTGVPCSFVKPLINYVIDSEEVPYLPAVLEGEAASIAAGAYLAGRRPVVLLQNSGLGNIVNPVTSLHLIYDIPALFLVTWRGRPGLKDAAQHRVMGEITPDLLTLMGVPNAVLEDSESRLDEILDQAEKAFLQRKCFAIVVPRGIIAPRELESGASYKREREFDSRTLGKLGEAPERDAVMMEIARGLGDDPAVGSTGFISRSLFNAGDREGNFYMQGSMGYASSIALGVSRFHEGPVFAVDGDGALLMHANVMLTAGAFHRKNLVHVLLDNNRHDSTGGQVTISDNVRFDLLAQAAGYEMYREVNDISLLAECMRDAAGSGKLCMIRVPMKPGAGEKNERPDLTPPELSERFRKFLAARNGTAR